MRIAVVVPMLPPLFNWPRTIRLSCPSNLSSLRVLGRGCDFAPEDAAADDRVEQHQREHEQALAPEHEPRLRRRRFVDGEDEGDHVRQNEMARVAKAAKKIRTTIAVSSGTSRSPPTRWPARAAVRGRHATAVGKFGTSISAKAMARTRSDHPGRISGPSSGHSEIVAGSMFKCSATISGGECLSQSDNEISSYCAVLNTAKNCSSVLPTFST